MTLQSKTTCAACLATILALSAPGTVGHDDSGSSYPGPNDDAVTGIYQGAAGTMTTSGATWPLLNCDMEVQGGGSAPSPLDEGVVDGSAAGAFPDGTWDDGGIGGACHTRNYLYAPYNTPGCGGGDVARASDTVLGGSVWIGAACDYQTMGNLCGSDGIIDAINFGSGTPGVPYPSGSWASSGCAASDAVMAVIVFDSTNGVATNGMIWAD